MCVEESFRLLCVVVYFKRRKQAISRTVYSTPASFTVYSTLNPKRYNAFFFPSLNRNLQVFFLYGSELIIFHIKIYRRKTHKCVCLYREIRSERYILRWNWLLNQNFKNKSRNIWIILQSNPKMFILPIKLRHRRNGWMIIFISLWNLSKIR